MNILHSTYNVWSLSWAHQDIVLGAFHQQLLTDCLHVPVLVIIPVEDRQICLGVYPLRLRSSRHQALYGSPIMSEAGLLKIKTQIYLQIRLTDNHSIQGYCIKCSFSRITAASNFTFFLSRVSGIGLNCDADLETMFYDAFATSIHCDRKRNSVPSPPPSTTCIHRCHTTYTKLPGIPDQCNYTAGVLMYAPPGYAPLQGVWVP